MVSCAFYLLPKIKLCVKILSVGGGVFFQSASLQVQPRLTKRAVDGGDSSPFSSIFLASGFGSGQVASDALARL